MQITFRGATVRFEAAFFTAAGDPASPDSVELSIASVRGGTRVTDQFAMSFDIFKSVWWYEWTTVNVAPGTIQWSLTSDPATPPVYVNDGTFELLANYANLDE